MSDVRPIEWPLPSETYAMKKIGSLSKLHSNRSLWHFQLGFFFLNLGVRCSQLAVAWWSLRVTQSASVFATMLAFATCSELIARLLLGSLADRYNKIKVVIACNIVAAVACALLAGMSYAQIFQPVCVALLMAMIGGAIGIRDPIQSSIIPALVEPDNVSAAFGTKGMLYSCALLIGAPIAGLWVSSVGEAKTLFADLVSISIGSILIAPVLKRLSANGSAHFSDRTATSSWWRRSLAGLNMLRRVKAAFYLSVFAMCANFSLFPFFFVMMPFYVQRETHQPAWVLGALDSAFAVGIFVGSGGPVKAANALLKRDHAVALGFGLLALNMLTILAFRSYVPLSGAFLMGGLGLMLINMNTSTVRALATPSSHLNQMTSIVSFLSTAINPVGSFVAAGLMSIFGFKITLGCLASLSIACGLIIPFVPEVRRFMRMPNEALAGAYGVTYPEAFR